jgi:hypothetical protein
VKKEKNIQICKILKVFDTANALKKQNEIRKKYGLRPLKRLQIETVLYFLNDDKEQHIQEYIYPEYGGMYQ